MTETHPESTTDPALSLTHRADSTFQRIAFRFITVFLLLVIATWEVIRGLNPDTFQLRDSLHKTVSNLEESQAKLKAERDELAKANATLNGRIKAFQEYADYEASARSLRANHRMPIGRLGFPLGTYLTIEGRHAPKAEPGRASKASRNCLLIDRVNEKPVEPPIGVVFDNLDVTKMKADRFILKGYETGHPIGIPDGIPEYEDKPRPQAAWHFREYFWVTTVVKPEDATSNSQQRRLNP